MRGKARQASGKACGQAGGLRNAGAVRGWPTRPGGRSRSALSAGPSRRFRLCGWPAQRRQSARPGAMPGAGAGRGGRGGVRWGAVRWRGKSRGFGRHLGPGRALPCVGGGGGVEDGLDGHLRRRRRFGVRRPRRRRRRRNRRGAGRAAIRGGSTTSRAYPAPLLRVGSAAGGRTRRLG